MATFIYPAVPIDTTGLALEATLLLVEANTADTVTELQSQNTILTDNSQKTQIVDAIGSTPAIGAGPPSGAEFGIVTRNIPSGVQDVSVTASVLPTGAATEATLATRASEATLANVQTAVDALNARLAGSLVPVAFDEQDITYVTVGNGIGEIETVVYKLASTTVATLTMTYDANDKLINVVKS